MENERLQKDIAEFVADFPFADELRGKTIAVTGATGLLGSCMVRCLLALNREKELELRVIAVVRNREKAVRMFGGERRDFVYYCYDFGSGHPFKPRKRVDYLLHFAAPTASRYFVEHPVETMNDVIMGMKSLLGYARTSQVKGIVLASSLEVYGTITDDSEPLTEDKQGYLDPMDVRSSYPMAKRAAEMLCHSYATEYGVEAKVARLAQTFGAGVAADDNRVFAQFARSVIESRDIVLHTTGELSRSYCYTTDVVTAMLCIMLHGKRGETYNVANETTYISVREMAEKVAKTFNPQIEVVVKPQTGLGYSPTTKLRLSTQRIEALGWKPRLGLEEMFGRLIISMKQDKE